MMTGTPDFDSFVAAYAPTILALGVTGGLLLVQLVVADRAAIAHKHTPGTPVPADHELFLFRAVRAHANTNESIAAFLLLACFGMLSAASPRWLNGLAMLYVAGRIVHMACYYANVQTLRSAAFGVSLSALFGMLIAGVLSWL